MQQLQILTRDAWEEEAVKYMWNQMGGVLWSQSCDIGDVSMGKSWTQLKMSHLGHVICAKFKFMSPKMNLFLAANEMMYLTGSETE